MGQILYLQSRLRSGGPSNQLYYIVKNLNSDEYTPSIVTLSSEEEETDKPRFLEYGIPVHSLRFGRLEGLLRGGNALKKIVEKHEPAIVHSQGWRPDLLSAYYLGAFPRVSTVRNHAYEDYTMKFGPVQGRIMAWTHLQALQRIEKPVGCSQSVAAYLKSHGVEADFIRNGVDRDRFYPVDQTTSRNLRKKLGLSVSALIFVSVGHLRKRKDPLTVIEAFKSSNMSDKGELVMIGEGPLQKECENSARGNSNIHFTGRVDNVEEYLQASDVFVSASRSEGLPNTVMEALSTGLPVVLSDINPHKEILNQNPNAGIRFQVGNVCSATSALNSVKNIDIDVASRDAIGIAKNDLNAKIMSRKYQSTYSKIEKK